MAAAHVLVSLDHCKAAHESVSFLLEILVSSYYQKKKKKVPTVAIGSAKSPLKGPFGPFLSAPFTFMTFLTPLKLFLQDFPITILTY